MKVFLVKGFGGNVRLAVANARFDLRLAMAEQDQSHARVPR